jgi:hypothetical protein
VRTWLKDNYGKSSGPSVSAGPGEGYLILVAEDEEEARSLHAILGRCEQADEVRVTSAKIGISVPIYDLIELASGG